MRPQLRSETRKLLSTPSVYWLTIGAIAMAVMSIMGVTGQSEVEYGKRLWEQQFYFVGTFTKLLIVVVGIRIVTDEYRFGTIVPTFVYEPRRWKVVASKAVVGLGAGLAIAAIVQAVLVGGGTAMFSATGHDLLIGARGVQAIVGSTLAGMLWGGVGVAVGAIVRNQVTAIVGSFIWLMALEEVLVSRLGDLGDYLPGGNGFVLSLATPEAAAVTAFLVLSAYVIVGTGAGVWVTRVRDVT